MKSRSPDSSQLQQQWAAALPVGVMLAVSGSESAVLSPSPVRGLVGGVIIGLAAAFLLWTNGRIAGISGIFGGMLTRRAGDFVWRVAFVAGLLLGGLLVAAYLPHALPDGALFSAPRLAVAGLLVGFGVRMGSGCTSGHGVCGVGRMSPRSLIATATFTGAGALTVLAVSALVR